MRIIVYVRRSITYWVYDYRDAKTLPRTLSCRAQRRYELRKLPVAPFAACRAPVIRIPAQLAASSRHPALLSHGNKQVTSFSEFFTKICHEKRIRFSVNASTVQRIGRHRGVIFFCFFYYNINVSHGGSIKEAHCAANLLTAANFLVFIYIKMIIIIFFFYKKYV